MDEPEEPAAPWVEAVVEIAGVVDCAKAAEGAIAAALSVAATGIATIQRERRVKRDAVSRMEEFPLFSVGQATGTLMITSEGSPPPEKSRAKMPVRLQFNCVIFSQE